MVNALGNDMDGTHDSYGTGNLVAQDQPRHTVLRTVVRPSFAAGPVLALEQHIRGRARELLAGLAARGGGDFAAEFAIPLVFAASLKLMGIDPAESSFWEEHLMRSMVRTVGQFGVPADAAASNHEGEAHLDELMGRRAAEIAAGAEAGTPDVIGQILLADANGRLLEGERIGLGHLIFSASTDAPAALLTNCVAVLDKFPALQGYLRQHPGLVKAFVEETLRYDGPAKNLCRQTTSPVTIAGVTIPANARVMVLIGSASHDERVYPHPDRFDLFREITAENKILTFGEGIHSCMGAPLARLTAQVAVEELLAITGGVELRVVGVPGRWAKQMVRGFSRLPVRLVPVGTPPRSMRLAAIGPRDTESVQQRATRLTLTRREFEAVVRIEAKSPAAEDVVALTVREATGQPLPPWEPGAHVDLILDDVATRQYSLCGPPGDQQAYRLGILRDPHGSGGSLHVHDKLAAGDLARIRGPRNNFPLVPSPRYLFIAGGIGITPMLPMIAAASTAGAQWRLVYGGRRRSSMAFLDQLAAHGDQVTVWPQDERGLLPLADLLGTPQPDTLVYCCGPEPLLGAVEQGCAGWPAGSLHTERFVAKPLTEPVLAEAFDVHLQRSDLTLTVPVDRSILSVVEEAGVPVLSSCGEGTCGTCETPVLDGLPDHRDSVLDAGQRAAGDCMMICVSRSCTSRLVLDL
jgi:cytochrome P450/ferredoxin-NADP reductase